VKAPFLITAAFLLNAASAACQTPENRAGMLIKVLAQHHYAPRTLNDALSGQVFDRFLLTLDPNGLYFTQADLNVLNGYRLKLDDELNGKPAAFLKFVTPFYKEKLLRSRTLSQKILQTPFSFTQPENITFESEGPTFAADEKAHRIRWQKWLKYQTLALLVRSSTTEIKTVKPEAEAEARRKAGLVNERTFKRLLESPEGFENLVQNFYLNAITYAYDPHTLYLSQNEYEDYKGGTSREVFSFGLQVDENEIGEIEVSQVVPGSPAWKCNEINKGDVLEGIKPPGKSLLDLTGSDAYETQAMLDATQTGKIDFRIRKKNGLEKMVALAQEKVESENVVKGFLLQGDKKIGYISLPGFYSEWENEAGLGCANDVAREILKLRQEGMEGLILDIRYNGGGSMQEATSLAGLFVNEGPLLLMQGKDAKPQVIKDANRGTLYDGPLTVLVNSQSASASELLAATLQDYHRAVIVGMPTFGKATAQVVLPVGIKENLSLREQANLKSPNGYAVVTIEKLYRVTGKTAQLLGVQPDITFPDPFRDLFETEAGFETALPADSVVKNVYYAPLPALPVTGLRQKSETRLRNSPNFREMQAYSQANLLPQAPEFPLTLTGFRQALADSEKDQQTAEKFLKASAVSFTVQEPLPDQKLVQLSSYTREMNQHLKKQLEEDIYLEEAYQITKDLISATLKP
jgi:carboxyl-terminal processing protease